MLYRRTAPGTRGAGAYRYRAPQGFGGGSWLVTHQSLADLSRQTLFFQMHTVKMDVCRPVFILLLAGILADRPQVLVPGSEPSPVTNRRSINSSALL